jgi:hypothetical protein
MKEKVDAGFLLGPNKTSFYNVLNYKTVVCNKWWNEMTKKKLLSSVR